MSEKVENICVGIGIALILMFAIIIGYCLYGMFDDHNCWEMGYEPAHCQKYIQNP